MKLFVALLTSLLLPSSVYAGLEITEIMYSPASGGEWVEVYNNGDSPVDLKGYKLFDGTNHTISSASVLLPAGGFIILADDKSAFVSAYNAVSVPVLDIVTSLNNEGDTVVLRSASNVDLVSVTYGNSAGADKNGKSLQLISGEFLPYKAPTPGEPTQVTKSEVEAQIQLEKIQTPTTNPVSSASANTSSPYHAWPSDLAIYVNAGGDRVVLAGARVPFEGKVLSSAKKPLPNADLIWTFGDGGSDRGTRVGHTFHYPGKYIVILDVISGDYIAKDEIIVDVVAPKLTISRVEVGEKGYIEIRNDTIHKLDIGEYVIEVGGLVGSHFSIPKNTLVLAGSSIILPSQVTRLPSNTENVSIKFPGGDLITQYGIDYSATSTEKITSEKVLEINPNRVVPLVSNENVVSETFSRAKEYLASNIIPSVFAVLDRGSESQNQEYLETGFSTTTEDVIGSSTLATSTIFEGSPLVASPLNSKLPYYAGLAGIITLGVLFLVALRIIDGKQSGDDKINELVDEIEIIE